MSRLPQIADIASSITQFGSGPNGDIPLAFHHDLGSCRQLVEQRLCLFQIERIEAFSEPAVDWSQQFAGLLRLALIAPEARHADRGSQLPELGALSPGHGERVVEALLCSVAFVRG